MSDPRAVTSRLITEERARRSLTDFAQYMMGDSYQSAAHLDLLADHLAHLEARDYDRLAVSIGPRLGKSLHVSQLWPAFLCGRRPQDQTVIASYAADLAERHSRRAREFVSDSNFPFPGVGVSQQSFAVNCWQTILHGKPAGLIRAVGIDSGLIGYGSDTLIIDDIFESLRWADNPTNRDNVWQWYSNTASTRQMPRGIQVICGARFHDDDLFGRIMNSPGAHRWVRLEIPSLSEGPGDPLGRPKDAAIWPSRYDAAYYRGLVDEGVMSPRDYMAQHGCRPSPKSGTIFQASWLEKEWETLPSAPPPQSMDDFVRAQLMYQQGFEDQLLRARPVRDTVRVTGWDTSYGGEGVQANFSAGVTVEGAYIDGSPTFFLIDAVKEKVDADDLIELVRATRRRVRSNVVAIEKAASGIGLSQHLKRKHISVVECIPGNRSKTDRADKIVPWVKNHFWVPKKSAAPWFEAWKQEMTAFPTSRDDDYVDATVWAVQVCEAKLAEVVDYRRTMEQFGDNSWRYR